MLRPADVTLWKSGSWKKPDDGGNQQQRLRPVLRWSEAVLRAVREGMGTV